MHTLKWPLVLLVTAALVAGASIGNSEAYKDSSLPVEVRVEDLLSRMTLEEKIAQLHEQRKDFEIVDGKVTEESLEKSFQGMSYGTISGPFGAPAETIAIHNRDAQAYVRSKTRLGIPFLTVNETLHGGLSLGNTIYPQTIAQGATWNPELIKEMASAIAAEVRALGVVQALAPMSTLARDPRWGRVEECFGECPYLVSRFVVAYIEGMQGSLENGLAPDKMLCMSKVMAGYEMPHAGINIAGTSMGERELRSIYLAPHEAAVKEAGVASIMPSYNCVDGIPAHANRWLLTELLRHEWGFDGYVYADWGGVSFNHGLHRVAPTLMDAAIMALSAGVDLEAPSPYCYRYLAEAVKSGALDMSIIDTSVANVLRTKFRAALFDGADAAPPVDRLSQYMHTPQQIALARKIAEESVILLKNEGGLLPLDLAKTPSIAIIGPNAGQVQFGDYSATKDNAMGVTVLEAINAIASGNGMTVRHARGCDWVGFDKSGFPEAVQAAQESAVALVVVGDTSMNIGGGLPGSDTDRSLGMLATVGEGYDRSELTISGVQEELIKAVHATGTPTIVILVHGRPFAIPWIKEHIPAILDVFYPGEEGGNAIAGILFGNVNPSGRLPLSVPQSAGHIPVTYDYEPADRGFYKKPGTPEQPGRDYVFSSTDPLWPFGYGLSYTTFEYADLKIDTPAADQDGTIEFSFEVTNTGNREGLETAQIYYRKHYSSTVTPNMRLVRFLKTGLKPGESLRLSFSIPCRELALWNVDMKRVVETGEFDLLVGASAEDIRLKGNFSIVAENRE